MLSVTVKSLTDTEYFLIGNYNCFHRFSTETPFTRNRIRFPLFLPIRISYPSLSGECLPAFESREQIYPVNNSPGVDMCEQLVWVELEWISINARPTRIKFVRIGIVSGTCEQDRKSIQILVNTFPIRRNFL